MKNVTSVAQGLWQQLALKHTTYIGIQWPEVIHLRRQNTADNTSE